MAVVESLRKIIPWEVFDYQALLAALHNYAHSRDKITDLIAKNIIIRVKKGLYIFGDSYRLKPYSREILANLIYGPSCISLEYALHNHGLIPERSVALTSVTTKRLKSLKHLLASSFTRTSPRPDSMSDYHVSRWKMGARSLLLALRKLLQTNSGVTAG